MSTIISYALGLMLLAVRGSLSYRSGAFCTQRFGIGQHFLYSSKLGETHPIQATKLLL